MTWSTLLTATLTAFAAQQALGAPASSCTFSNGQYGQLQFGDNIAVSTTNGRLTVGDKPQQFALASCGPSHAEDFKGYVTDYNGYVVDSYDTSSCVTASSLAQSGATFSMQPCKFNSKGSIDSTQTFAWRLDYSSTSNIHLLFKGNAHGYINETNPTPYSFASSSASSNKLSNLTLQYNTNNKTSASNLVFKNSGSSGHPPAAEISCSTFKTGQLNFQNATYSGPLNKKFEAQHDTSDRYFFQTCNSTSRGFKQTKSKKYGRLRPTTDKTTHQYNCYMIDQTPAYDQTTLEPSGQSWVEGFQTTQCSDTEDYPLQDQFFELDTTTNELTFLHFNATQKPPAAFLWYTQLDYDREANITQYVWDPLGIGAAYVDPNSDFAKANPPGKVTLV